MAEWTPIEQKLPPDSDFVIANVRDDANSYIYSEILQFVYKEDQWKYHNGKPLEDGLRVSAWKNAGSTYVG
jgi:hypothetical protein